MQQPCRPRCAVCCSSKIVAVLTAVLLGLFRGDEWDESLWAPMCHDHGADPAVGFDLLAFESFKASAAEHLLVMTIMPRPSEGLPLYCALVSFGLLPEVCSCLLTVRHCGHMDMP